MKIASLINYCSNDYRFIKKVIDTPIVPILPAPVEDKIAEEIKAEEAKIEELKSEEIKGVD